jgi:hypothetical protein
LHAIAEGVNLQLACIEHPYDRIQDCERA